MNLVILLETLRTNHELLLETALETGVCYIDNHDTDGEVCFTCYRLQKEL